MGIVGRLFGGPGFFEARRQFTVAATLAKAALAEIKAEAARDDDSDRPPPRDSDDDYEPAPVSVALHG